MKLYDVAKTANLLQLSPLTIRKWLRSGKLKGVKIGKEWRISDEELKELFPEQDFFLDFGNKNPKMVDSRELARELYPEKYRKQYWMEFAQNPWDYFGDKIKEAVDEKYPYPFKSDEITYYNQDRTSYLLGRDIDSWQVYYSLKLKDEERNFDNLLNGLKEKYSISDNEIDEIKKLSQGIHLLTCIQPLYDDSLIESD